MKHPDPSEKFTPKEMRAWTPAKLTLSVAELEVQLEEMKAKGAKPDDQKFRQVKVDLRAARHYWRSIREALDPEFETAADSKDKA